MLIRQRNMRITVTSFVEEMARVVPPLRRQLALTRRDFRQRFLAEEEMLNALTPPGFDAAARVSPRFAPTMQQPHLCLGRREGRAGAVFMQGWVVSFDIAAISLFGQRKGELCNEITLLILWI